MSTEFTVTWTIELSADHPSDAARLAREIQRDPNSTATVFEVSPVDTPNGRVLIDLRVN